MPKILSDRIIYDVDDWLGGLVPQANNSLALTMGSGAAYQRNVNPYRSLGAIVPGFMPTAVVNEGNLDDVVVAGDSDYSGSTPYAYLLGANGKINRLDLTSDTVSGGATAFPHQINDGHSSIVGRDLVVFTITSGVSSSTSTFAMASFSDATDGNICAHDITSGLGVFYETFLSTQPEGGITLTTDPHPTIIGGDGVLYIGNGNTLVALDGTTGGSGVVSTKLTFPKGTVIRSFTKTAGYLVIFASRSNLATSASYGGTSTAYFWNYTASKFNFDYDLSDNIVTAGFNRNGVVGCFTYGRAAEGGALTTKIKLFTGSRFKQVHEFRNNPPGHKSVDIHDTLVAFVFGDNTQSYIGSYGSPWEGRIQDAFNFWGEPQGTGLGLNTGGLCRNLGGLKLYVSSGAGMSTFSASYGPNSGNGSFFYGLHTSPSFPSKMRGRIKSVKVHFRDIFTAGRAVSIGLQLDSAASTTLTVVNAVSTISSYGNTIVEYFMDSNNKPLTDYQFHSLAPRIIWDTGTDGGDAPAIKKLEIFFEAVQFNQA